MSIIGGWHAVEAACSQHPEALRAIWIAASRQDARAQALFTVAESLGIPMQAVDKATLDQRSGGLVHQGVVAEYAKPPKPLGISEILARIAESTDPALLLVLDGVQDPHNLGACLRSAAAAGVHAVIVPTDKAVGLNATVRKVASGGAEVVPLVAVTNLARTLRALKEQGIWLVGADGEAPHSLYTVDFQAPTAIILGAEGKGLRRLTREACDILAQIPMRSDTVHSLNVSVAAGIFLFEARRQRAALL